MADALLCKLGVGGSGIVAKTATAKASSDFTTNTLSFTVENEPSWYLISLDLHNSNSGSRVISVFSKDGSNFIIKSDYSENTNFHDVNAYVNTRAPTTSYSDGTFTITLPTYNYFIVSGIYTMLYD